MASRSTNTQAEALQNLIKEIAGIKLMPDADLPFLIDIETGILQYLHSKLPGGTPSEQLGPAPSPEQQMGQMQTGVMGPPPDAMAGMMAGGPAPGGMAPPPGPGGPAGIRMRPAAPNPDELRRMIQR